MTIRHAFVPDLRQASMYIDLDIHRR